LDKFKIGVVGISDGWSTQQLAERVEARTGYNCIIEMKNVALCSSEKRVTHGDTILNDLDALIVKKVGRTYTPDFNDRLEILRFLKHRGVRIFSDPRSMAVAIDRFSNTVTLQCGDIPMPATVATESVDEAKMAVKKFGKAVFKPLFTSKARGMEVIEDGDDTEDKIRAYKQAGNPLMYIQKMMKLPGRDLGLVFVGGEYLGTYARVGNGDSWNTTTHSGGHYQAHEPSEKLIELARKAQALFGLDFTSVDVAETSEGPIVFEVSAFGGFRGLHVACGIDAAERYVDHVVNQLRAAK